MAAVVAGDIITLGGVPFTAVAVPANPALQQFEDTATAGSNILCAAALALAMNNAATDALLIASAVGGSSVTVVNGGTDTVTITADTVGPVGAMPLIEDTAGVRIVLGDATGHLDRAYEEWTTAHIIAASAAIIARVDAGQTLTEANINTAINGVVGVTGVDIVHASSSSTVLEILSILSGRRYQIARDVQFASAEGRWESAAVPVGAFTENVSVFDSRAARPLRRWRTGRSAGCRMRPSPCSPTTTTRCSTEPTLSSSSRVRRPPRSLTLVWSRPTTTTERCSKRRKESWPVHTS
jgi:hypothetical protein